MTQRPALTFGIYPGGPAGTTGGMNTGPADDPAKIEAALNALQERPDVPFVVRGYIPFRDPGDTRSFAHVTPTGMERYIHDGRRLDLVLQYQSPSGNVDGFLSFVREQIRRYGALATTIQVTEEVNVVGHGMDGDFVRAREALIAGVIAAKNEARRSGHEHLRIGFNATPSFDPANEFWASLHTPDEGAFLAALDYVGLDFFPDVFRRLAPDGEPGDLRSSVTAVLRAMRESWLPAAGIPRGVPIHITEHGWSTGPDRDAGRQAEILEIVLRIIAEGREALNIAHYSHFDLRDADTSNPDPYHHFGLLRDDYTPKPAFARYRDLIAELGAA